MVNPIFKEKFELSESVVIECFSKQPFAFIGDRRIAALVTIHIPPHY